MRKALHFLAAILPAVLLAAPALAQDFHPEDRFNAGIIDELRLGVGAHDAYHSFWPNLHPNLSDISDLSFDILFRTPDIDAFKWIGSPRPELGTTVNFNGEESILHAALMWDIPIFDTGAFIELGAGGAIHNGHLDDAPPGGRNLGCRVLFYERMGIGMNIGDSATVSLAEEHISNSDLCDYNNGISNVGIRVGWKF